MKLFHGTSLKRGKQILKDRKLKGSDVERVYTSENISIPTTDGYVYLTDFATAAYYANKTSAVTDRDAYLVLFEIDVDDTILEPDKDEIDYTLRPFGLISNFVDIENPTVKECWEACRALRVKGDILLEAGKFKYTILRSNMTLIDEQEDLPQNSRDFTMRIVDLKWAFDDESEIEKIELYNQINWKTEF